ncbi:hypothetical protein ACP4OV_014529 [Aristida adscensionis]
MNALVRNKSWWYIACDRCKELQNLMALHIHAAMQTSHLHRRSQDIGFVFLHLAGDHLQVLRKLRLELVFFGPVVEELIGSPVEALIAAGPSADSPLSSKLSRIYGKHEDQRVSWSTAAEDNRVSSGCHSWSSLASALISFPPPIDLLPHSA